MYFLPGILRPARLRTFWVLLCLGSLLCLGLLLGHAPIARAAAPPEPLAAVLRDLSPERLLELRLANADFVRGHLVVVRNDSILLRTEGPAGEIRACALAEITSVREWRSSSGRGAAWGATSGAIIVGSFGVLMGAYLSSINDSGDSDAGPVIGLGLLAAAAGGAAGSLLGLGVGALTVAWHEIWPRNGSIAEGAPPSYADATRLGFFAGTARPLLEGFEVSRFAARVSLRKSLGGLVDLGPEISFHKFEGASRTQSPAGISYESGKENLLKIALAANLRRLRPGLSPYATTGFGWFLSNDAYLGAHLGGGLRWQFNGGNDLEFDLRYHFNITDVDRGEVDKFWTVGLGLGFDL